MDPLTEGIARIGRVRSGGYQHTRPHQFERVFLRFLEQVSGHLTPFCSSSVITRAASFFRSSTNQGGAVSR